MNITLLVICFVNAYVNNQLLGNNGSIYRPCTTINKGQQWNTVTRYGSITNKARDNVKHITVKSNIDTFAYQVGMKRERGIGGATHRRRRERADVGHVPVGAHIDGLRPRDVIVSAYACVLQCQVFSHYDAAATTTRFSCETG